MSRERAADYSLKKTLSCLLKKRKLVFCHTRYISVNVTIFCWTLAPAVISVTANVSCRTVRYLEFNQILRSDTDPAGISPSCRRTGYTRVDRSIGR